MNDRVRWLAVAVGLLLSLPIAAHAQQWAAPKPTDKVESGVNWTTHVVYARAVGVVPPDAVSVEHGRTLAIIAGTVLARQELLALARGVAIDARTTVQNLMVKNSVTEARVSGVVRGALVVETRDLGGGAFEVTVAIPATGEFADLLLPSSPASRPAPSLQVAATAPAPAPAVPSDRPKPVVLTYTGLVIDARGLGVKPAMAPKILSKGGQEIYGFSVVDRNRVIEQGMAGYSKDLAAAQTHDRVASRPITIKAVAAAGANKTDLVISDADAQLLEGSGQILTILEQARVMLVVD